MYSSLLYSLVPRISPFWITSCTTWVTSISGNGRFTIRPAPYCMPSFSREGKANAAIEKTTIEKTTIEKITIVAVFHRPIQVRPEGLPDRQGRLEAIFEFPTKFPLLAQESQL